MKNDFWTSYTYQVIQAMKATGNQPGVIAQWIGAAHLWANANDGADAAALRAWLPHWQARPFYTVRELAPIWPALAVAIGISKYLPPTRNPRRLGFELEYGGLPRLQNSNGDVTFRNPITCIMEPFYIVEQIHRWKDRPLTQEEFENVLFG